MNMDNFNKLKKLLDTMDVPELRKSDRKWLMINLADKNQNHPNFNEAMNLIRKW